MMTNINFSTYLKDIEFSDKFKDFWDNTFVTTYNKSESFRSNCKNLQELINDNKKFYQLTQLIESYNYKKYYDNNKKFDPSLCNKVLDILNRDIVDITQLIRDNYKTNNEKQNLRGFINIYTDYLKQNNKKIDKFTQVNFFKDMLHSKHYYREQDCNETITTFFNIIEVMPKEIINYNWFIKSLKAMSLIIDNDTREMIMSEYFSYDTQNLIYNYIKENFSKYIKNNTNYYSDIIKDKNFSIQQFFGIEKLSSYLINLLIKHMDKFSSNSTKDLL